MDGRKNTWRLILTLAIVALSSLACVSRTAVEALMPDARTKGAVFEILHIEQLDYVQIEGSSMEPTLHDGDRLSLDWKVVEKGWEPERFDVVLMLPYGDHSYMVVKRVIGFPGETIELRNGDLYINGEFVSEESRLSDGTLNGSWTVRENEIFLLGDNRDASTDSTEMTYTRNMIVAKVILPNE